MALASAQVGLVARSVRPRRACRRGRGLRIHAGAGRRPRAGRPGSQRHDGGALQVDAHAGGGAAVLHQSGAARQDDLDLRPALGRAHLHQPDRRPKRGRERLRGHQVGQGRALRDHGRGSLDPEGAMDGARPGEFRRQVLSIEGRADPALSVAEALSEVLSRRRLEASVGDFGQAFRRASVLGRYLRAHPRQHGGDQSHGRGARPREGDRLRHAPAGRLPARPRKRHGTSRMGWWPMPARRRRPS